MKRSVPLSITLKSLVISSVPSTVADEVNAVVCILTIKAGLLSLLQFFSRSRSEHSMKRAPSPGNFQGKKRKINKIRALLQAAQGKSKFIYSA